MPCNNMLYLKFHFFGILGCLSGPCVDTSVFDYNQHKCFFVHCLLCVFDPSHFEWILLIYKCIVFISYKNPGLWIWSGSQLKSFERNCVWTISQSMVGCLAGCQLEVLGLVGWFQSLPQLCRSTVGPGTGQIILVRYCRWSITDRILLNNWMDNFWSAGSQLLA